MNLYQYHRVTVFMAWLGAATMLAGAGAARADNGIGAWSASAPWPLIPIHAMLLPDGRVLSYGTDGNGTQTGRLIYDLWNPALGLTNANSSPHWTLPNQTGTDLFCSAQIVVPPTGDVLLLGGDNWISPPGVTNNRGNNDANLFSTRNGTTISRAGDMNRPRWYATATTLMSGNIYIQGGRDGEDRPEIRKADGTFKLLTGADTTPVYWWYPRNWLLPDGRIFGLSDRLMYRIDPFGNGAYTRLGALPLDGPTGITSSEVMYRPGLILRVGGGASGSSGGIDGKAAAQVIDITGDAPQVVTVPPMPVGLHWHTATVVADGKVVVTGGSLKNNQLDGVNDRALIWAPAAGDPRTGTWTTGASGTPPGAAQRARLYHSIALLLPDATLLVGGGGAPGPQKNLDAQIFYPPYLFTASGAWAPRPRITSSPTRFSVGKSLTFSVSATGPIARVTLLRTGSVTHSFNMEQRFYELPILSRDNGAVTVTMPASKGLAPPGRYLLFAIDAQGVPSVARILTLL